VIDYESILGFEYFLNIVIPFLMRPILQFMDHLFDYVHIYQSQP